MARDRPYTFIVLALLTLILSPVVILRTPSPLAQQIPDHTGWTAHAVGGGLVVRRGPSGRRGFASHDAGCLVGSLIATASLSPP